MGSKWGSNGFSGDSSFMFWALKDTATAPPPFNAAFQPGSARESSVSSQLPRRSAPRASWASWRTP